MHGGRAGYGARRRVLLLLAMTTVLTSACSAFRRGPAPIPPTEARPFQEGIASWYGPGFQGRPTASGVPFDPSQLTAAHPTLPFGTRVRVVHTASGREVVVLINDRGPFVPGRIIDLSHAAAEALGMVDAGLARVALFLLDQEH